MPTVLVTGGAGYIGSHAVKALVLAGHQVIVYDNLSAGHREAVTAVQQAAGRHGAGASRVTFVEGDIRDTPRLTRALAGESTAVRAAFGVAGVDPADRPLPPPSVELERAFRCVVDAFREAQAY